MVKTPSISNAGRHLSALEFHSVLQNSGIYLHLFFISYEMKEFFRFLMLSLLWIVFCLLNYCQFCLLLCNYFFFIVNYVSFCLEFNNRKWSLIIDFCWNMYYRESHASFGRFGCKFSNFRVRRVDDVHVTSLTGWRFV